MSQNSPRLGLPMIQPSQAQKHVTHNEALRLLDLSVQLSVVATGASNPPAAPDQGDIHALGLSPSGDWTGHGGELAAWLDNTWHFIIPGTGWRAWDQSASEMKLWDGAAWIAVPPATQNLAGVGVGTGYDSTNRLSVRSEASLFSHDGAGHQLKINKSDASDTATMLFQSNWTGHAEMGLAGTTGFSIKVSPDGSSWTEAFTFDQTTGHVSGAAVQASPDDVTSGRLMRADYGYGPGNLLGPVSQSGGTPTGAVLERGTTAEGEFLKFADGTQICTAALTATGCTTPEGAMYSSAAASWIFPAAFAPGTTPIVSGSAGATGRFAGFDGPTETQVSYKILSAVSDATDAPPSAIAIGRWY